MDIARFIPDRITPCTTLEMFDAIGHALPELRWRARCVLTAQWSLETGGGRAMHCFNVGNAKGRPDGTRGHWTYFWCDEILSDEAAARVVRSARARTDGTPGPDAQFGGTPKGGKIRVVFYPSNIGACFRAFESLTEGVADHLAMLERRFADAFAELRGDAPNPHRYALRLGTYEDADTRAAGLVQTDLLGYYTAPSGAYADRILQLTNDVDDEMYVRCGLRKLRMADDIAAFQAHRGIKVDGEAGPTTRFEMAVALGDVNP